MPRSPGPHYSATLLPLGSVALTPTCPRGSSCGQAPSVQTCSSHRLQDEAQAQAGSLAGVEPTALLGLSQPSAPRAQPSPGAPAPPALTLPPLVLSLHQAPVGRALPCPVIFQSPAVLPPVTPAPWKETPLTCTATATRRTEWRGTEWRGRRPPQAGPWEGRTQTWGEGAAPGLHSSSCWSRSPSRPESPGRGAQVLHGARGSAGPKRRVR